ncbi:MAG: cation diffusion facilitator family transporter [Bdellovibrionia bacterium]
MHTETRKQAATLALGVTIGLTALKLGVAYVSDSVGVLSEAIHSFLDLISAGVSFFTIRVAGKPADEDHPYGHGKIETLSSLFESIHLVAAAVLIIFEGVDHLRHPMAIRHGGLALGVMGVSIVVSYFTFQHNFNAAQETESSALHVNALHFLSDVVASLGVFLGLILLEWTGWVMIDPLIAFAVAGYILVISVGQVKKSLMELADTQLPSEELEKIKQVVQQCQGELLAAQEIRTRKSGATRHIDFNLVVCGHMTVDASHALCDEVEAKITEVFPRASINIHVEPCEKERTKCQTQCPIAFRRK